MGFKGHKFDQDFLHFLPVFWHTYLMIFQSETAHIALLFTNFIKKNEENYAKPFKPISPWPLPKYETHVSGP